MLRRLCVAAIALAVSSLALSLPANAQEGPVYQTIPSIGIDGPVYFRNAYAFTDDRGGQGASAALIAVEGKVYALTAKHLLTDAMGIEPSVKPSEFDKVLDYWLLVDNPGLYDPDSARIVVTATGIYNTDDDWNDDIMLLAMETPLEDVADYVLPVAKTLPAVGAGVVLVGCPYSAKGGCGQNIYPGNVLQASDGSVIVKLKDPPGSLSGFSGAPIVNSSGEIIAVLYGGSGDMVQGTVLPDWLRK